jgi:hypothetical protein
MIQREDSNSAIADAFRFDLRLLAASSHALLLATETNGPRVKGGASSRLAGVLRPSTLCA